MDGGFKFEWMGWEGHVSIRHATGTSDPNSEISMAAFQGLCFMTFVFVETASSMSSHCRINLLLTVATLAVDRLSTWTATLE